MTSARRSPPTPSRDARTSNPAKLLIGFLGAEPACDCAQKLAAIKVVRKRCRIRPRNFFVHFADGVGNSKVSTAQLDRAAGVFCTARNLNTVRKLLELAEAQGTRALVSPRYVAALCVCGNRSRAGPCSRRRLACADGRARNAQLARAHVRAVCWPAPVAALGTPTRACACARCRLACADGRARNALLARAYMRAVGWPAPIVALGTCYSRAHMRAVGWRAPMAALGTRYSRVRMCAL